MKSNKKLIVIIAAVIIVIGGMIGAYIAFSGGDIFSEGVNDIEIKVINEDMGEYMQRESLRTMFSALKPEAGQTAYRYMT